MPKPIMKVHAIDGSYQEAVLESTFTAEIGGSTFTFALHRNCGSGIYYRVSEFSTGMGVGDVRGPLNHLVMVDDPYTAGDVQRFAQAVLRDTISRVGDARMLERLLQNRAEKPVVNDLPEPGAA